MPRGRDEACGLLLRQRLRSLPGLVHQGILHQARGPHPVHEVTAYTSADQSVKDVAGSGEVNMDFGTAMEIIVVTVNAYGSTRSNTQIMLRVVSLEEELFDVPEYQGVPILVPQENEPLFSSTLACVSYVNSIGPSVPQEDILACKSKGSVYTPLGLCGVTAGSSVAVAIKPSRMAKIQGNRYRRMRRPTTPKLLLGILACPFSVGSLKPAIFVVTAVGPLLTISGTVQEKVDVDLGIEFPNDLRPEPAEGGSLDEALKAGAPSSLWSAPGESLDTAKELSGKFDAEEDVEIIQADAAESVDASVRYRGRLL